MANLANAYNMAGRHADAFSLHQKALDFRQSNLPASHPDIGAHWPLLHNSCFDDWWMLRVEYALHCNHVLLDGQTTARVGFGPESLRVLAARAATEPSVPW